MPPLENVANRLLKLEFQLRAYQQLHEEELAELWNALDDCKQKIAASYDETGNSLEQITGQPVLIETAEEQEE